METISERRTREINHEVMEEVRRCNLDPELASITMMFRALDDGFKLGEMGIDPDMDADEAEKLIQLKSGKIG